MTINAGLMGLRLLNVTRLNHAYRFTTVRTALFATLTNEQQLEFVENSVKGKAKRHRKKATKKMMVPTEKLPPEPAEPVGPERTGMRKKKALLEIEMREQFGPDCLSTRHKNFRKVCCLANEEIAEVIATHLQKDVDDGRSILEANPGFGYLSRRLIAMGCRQLYLYADKKSVFLPALSKLANEHPQSVRLISENILKLCSIIRYDLVTGSDREDTLFAGLPVQQDWATPPKLTLFAPLNAYTEYGFLRSLLFMMPPREGLFHLGRVELLLIISQYEYDVLSLIAKSPAAMLRPYPVLYNLLFDSEVVDSVEPTDLFSTRHPKPFRSDKLYLVRLRPREKYPEIVAKHFDEFVFFITQCLRPDISVAQSIDMWIPRGYRDVFVEISKADSVLRDVYFGAKLHSVTVAELVELFRIFRNHEAFEYSPFIDALQRKSDDQLSVKEL